MIVVCNSLILVPKTLNNEYLEYIHKLPKTISHLPKLMDLLCNKIQLRQLLNHQIKSLHAISQIQPIYKLDYILSVSYQRGQVSISLLLPL